MLLCFVDWIFIGHSSCYQVVVYFVLFFNGCCYYQPFGYDDDNYYSLSSMIISMMFILASHYYICYCYSYHYDCYYYNLLLQIIAMPTVSQYTHDDPFVSCTAALSCLSSSLSMGRDNFVTTLPVSHPAFLSISKYSMIVVVIVTSLLYMTYYYYQQYVIANLPIYLTCHFSVYIV